MTLESNHRTFERLVRLAERAYAEGHLEAASGWTELAAEYAWRNHAGQFASARLESLLLDVSGRIPARPDAARVDGGTLHVLTDAARMGGHVNLVTRWIGWQADRRHSLAIIAGDAVAPPLLDAAAASGGNVTFLRDDGPSLLRRAGRLRALALGSDLVVLHADPHDAVPLLAFGAAAERPPAVLVNHADHLFWLGVAGADAIAHFRQSGRIHASERRGVDDTRSLDLPIPLPARGAPVDRRAARSQLGLDDRAVVAVTVASAYKYSGRPGTTLPELAAPALARLPGARLYALGPTWAGHPSIRALGPRPDANVWMQAADIYVDSHPLTSVTSLLEAAQHDLPILRFNADPGRTPCLFEPGDPALVAGTTVAGTAAEWGEWFAVLAGDPGLREELGRAGRLAVETEHTGERWRLSAERLDAVVRQPPMSARDARRSEVIDVALAELHALGGVDTAFLAQVPDHLRTIGGRRVSNTARLVLATRSDAPRFARRIGAAARKRLPG